MCGKVKMEHRHESVVTTKRDVFLLNSDSDMNEVCNVLNERFPQVSEDTLILMESESLEDGDGNLISFRIGVTPKKRHETDE